VPEFRGFDDMELIFKNISVLYCKRKTARIYWFRWYRANVL